MPNGSYTQRRTRGSLPRRRSHFNSSCCTRRSAVVGSAMNCCRRSASQSRRSSRCSADCRTNGSSELCCQASDISRFGTQLGASATPRAPATNRPPGPSEAHLGEPLLHRRSDELGSAHLPTRGTTHHGGRRAWPVLPPIH